MATTLPIWIGGVIRGAADWLNNRGKEAKPTDHVDEELGMGNLFATGLVAGGALAGVLIALLSVSVPALAQFTIVEELITNVIGHGGYQLLAWHALP